MLITIKYNIIWEGKFLVYEAVAAFFAGSKLDFDFSSQIDY